MDYNLIKTGIENFFDLAGIDLTEEEIEKEINDILMALREFRSTSPFEYDYFVSEFSQIGKLRVLYRYLSEIYNIDIPEQILKNYYYISPSSVEITNNITETLTEDVILMETSSIYAMLSIFFSLLMIRNRFPDFFVKMEGNIAKRVGSFLRYIGEKFSKLGRKWTLRYAIIIGQFDECAPLCDVSDIKDLNISRSIIKDLFYPFQLIFLKTIDYAKVGNKMKCMIRCYLFNLCDLIDLVFKSYLQCLVNMKKYIDILQIDVREIVYKIKTLEQAPTIFKNVSDIKKGETEECVPYLLIMKNLVNVLDSTLEIVAKKSPQLNAEIVDYLEKKLFDSKKDVVNSREFQQNQQFQRKRTT